MIIGVGGFLGMGEKDVAAPFSSVRASEKTTSGYLVLNTNKEALKAAPGFTYGKIKTTWSLLTNSWIVSAARVNGNVGDARRELTLAHVRRRMARAGKASEMALRMPIEIGLELFASIAVLDRIPESQIESVSSGIRKRRSRRGSRGGVKPCSSERGKRTIRVLFEIGFRARPGCRP